MFFANAALCAWVLAGSSQISEAGRLLKSRDAQLTVETPVSSVVSEETKSLSMRQNSTSKDFQIPDMYPSPIQSDEVARLETGDHLWSRCYKAVAVNDKSSESDRCPQACPFYTEDEDASTTCSFKCVDERHCPHLAPIPDVTLGVCRPPRVNFCREYNFDGTDTCHQCQYFYTLTQDGQCVSDYDFLCRMALAVILGIVLLLLFWLGDLEFRPIINKGGLLTAQTFRSRSKILYTAKVRGEGGNVARKSYPLRTNLMKKDVAGPGMMLFFNFQARVIGWALVVGVGWVLLGFYLDSDLLILGTRQMGTPRNNCILLDWGLKTQNDLMWVKVLYLFFVYVYTFAGCLYHGARQLQSFQVIDFKQKTMKDFVAFCENMPILDGSESDVEFKLKETFTKATGQEIVGVSVCWNYGPHQQQIRDACEADIIEAEDKYNAQEAEQSMKESGQAQSVQSIVKPQMGPIRSYAYSIEGKLFGAPESTEDDAPLSSRCDLVAILKEMKSSACAFVVFATEAERDAAVSLANKNGGIECRGNMVQLKTIECEPHGVQWENFNDRQTSAYVGRGMVGVGFVFLGILFWTTVFYMPYMWSILSFNYSNGQVPDASYAYSFAFVVMIGNQIMYQICAMVSDYIGFRFRDDREATYMVFYSAATSFNVILDLVANYFISWEIVKTLHCVSCNDPKDGSLFNIVQAASTAYQDWETKFKSYPMQRSLAQSTFEYGFPATFLLPFIAEPIATIWLPWKLGSLVIRTHPELFGRAAERALEAWEFDFGRYADLLLNIFIGISVLFFPGGWTHTLFLLLAVSHTYIYLLDHYRILRCTPKCNFASMQVDRCCQVLLVPLCALLLAGLVFKGNCQRLEKVPILRRLDYCTDSAENLVGVSIIAFFVHCVVHVACLVFIIPRCGIDKDTYMIKKDKDSARVRERQRYEAMAAFRAASWFNTNPVHCLRSRLIHRHIPACRWFLHGKEHLLEVNDQIGCHFHSKAAEIDFDPEMTRVSTVERLFTYSAQRAQTKPETPTKKIGGSFEAQRKPDQDFDDLNVRGGRSKTMG